jgi:hypothetical protein
LVDNSNQFFHGRKPPLSNVSIGGFRPVYCFYTPFFACLIGQARLLHNSQTCDKQRTIERTKHDDLVRIVYAYDWNMLSDNPSLINNEVTSVTRDIEKEYLVKFSFRSLGAKDGSIYCDICRQIKSADVALFDLSTYNLNVILELGLAIGVGTYVFLLRSRHCQQRPGSLSDLNGILEYRFSRRSGRLTFQADFRRSLRSKLRLAAKRRMKNTKEQTLR